MRIDLEQLDMIADGYTEDFNEIYHEFCADTPNLFVKLKEALSQKNAEATSRTAHTIKGSVSNFGMIAVGELMKQIEIQAKTGNLEGLEKIAANGEAEFGESLAEIKKLRNI